MSMEQERENEEPNEQNTTTLGDKQPKPFLKRRERGPVKFNKVDWKVKSRIDCWTKNESRSNNVSQTRRTLS